MTATLTVIGPGGTADAPVDIDVLQASTTPAYDYQASGYAEVTYRFTPAQDGVIRVDGLLSREVDGTGDVLTNAPYVAITTDRISLDDVYPITTPVTEPANNDVLVHVVAGQPILITALGIPSYDMSTSDITWGPINIVVRVSDYGPTLTPAGLVPFTWSTTETFEECPDGGDPYSSAPANLPLTAAETWAGWGPGVTTYTTLEHHSGTKSLVHTPRDSGVGGAQAGLYSLRFGDTDDTTGITTVRTWTWIKPDHLALYGNGNTHLGIHFAAGLGDVSRGIAFAPYVTDTGTFTNRWAFKYQLTTAGGRSVVDTGIVADGAWHQLMIELDADAADNGLIRGSIYDDSSLLWTTGWLPYEGLSYLGDDTSRTVAFAAELEVPGDPNSGPAPITYFDDIHINVAGARWVDATYGLPAIVDPTLSVPTTKLKDTRRRFTG